MKVLLVMGWMDGRSDTLHLPGESEIHVEHTY